MRVLVLGGAGFIGRHIVTALSAHGHEVVVGGRRVAASGMGAKTIFCDLARERNAESWRERVRGFEVVVNCAGVLRGPDMHAVHVAGPAALYQACRDVGVGRVVLVSAISARDDVDTDYARAKLGGEAVLRGSGVPWCILRPSLVYGRGSYGGTSLIRGMAGLPGPTPVPGPGGFLFTPIHVDDLAHAVREACERPDLAETTLEPVGPETLGLEEILRHYRSWLGFGRTRILHVPWPLMALAGRCGDLLGRGPIATNSLKQLAAGNAGDPDAFRETIGFAPRSLARALAENPAEVQDRWHARLFFLAPALTAALAMMWLVSGVVGLTHGGPAALRFTEAFGLPGGLAGPLMFVTCAMDLAIAVLLVLGRAATLVTIWQIALVAGYTVVLSVAFPALWADPFGPLLKNIPILVAILVQAVLARAR